MVLPVTTFLADIDLNTAVYPPITMLISKHQHFFAPQKNLNSHFLLPVSIFFDKVFPFKNTCTSMFHFRGSQFGYRDCSNVAMQ